MVKLIFVLLIFNVRRDLHLETALIEFKYMCVYKSMCL